MVVSLFYYFVTDGIYKRISSESCEFHGLYTLKVEEMCEFAASHLALSDTDTYAGQDEGRPYGCLYASNDWLGWYDPTNSPYPSTACGSYQGSNRYDCICAVPGNIVHFEIFLRVKS